MNIQQPSNLFGRRVQISGSANAHTEVDLIRYGHKLITGIVRQLMKEGCGLVVGAGKEPLAEGQTSGAESEQLPSIVFDWSALETAAECLREGIATWSESYGPPLVVVVSEKSESEIPVERLPLWRELLGKGLVRLESIQVGARSGAMLRERQAQYGDILLTLGGGTGVEHSASLYINRRRPVIPLDLPLGASRDDGTGGSLALYRQARSEPQRFFMLQEAFAATANARLANIATKSGNTDPDVVAGDVVGLMKALAPPHVFYTRLLNPKHEAHPRVEAFFRNVVDPVVQAAGYRRIDMGVDPTKHPFINVAVFEDLHYASIVVADVTAERPNCYIELGYALGNGARVIVTAEEGTPLPFDQNAIPCHFWTSGSSDMERRAELTEFWRKNIDRPPVVKR